MLKSNLWKELKQLVNNFNDICEDDEKLKLPLIYRKATLKDLKKEISKVRATIQIKIESYRKEKEDDEQDNLLTEPDEAEDEDKTTELAVGGVTGAITPLGTGSTYPDKQKKKKKKKPVYGSVVSDKRKA